MHWSEVWGGRSVSAALARTALTPLSWLYAAGWQSYLAMYRLGIKKPVEPHRPVICLGNLQVGGTGKSPFAQFVAQEILSLGRSVVLGCSGYGSPRSEGATIAPEGELDAHEWSDEAAMHRWLHPDVPLVVGRDRVRAAQLCHEMFPDAALVMDDGFQHLPLKKHATIVLDPPVWNTRCLPAGPYREPHGNRRRADLVIPGAFEVVPSVMRFLSGDRSAIANFAGAEVTVLCALGQPRQFVDAVAASGLRVRAERLLPDHDPMAAGNLFDGLDASLPLVCTAKDWVKLRSRKDLADRTVRIATRSLRVEPADRFRAWLAERLDD